MMEVKRKTPFTPREKAFFFTLVKGYKIIENKKTDAAASHQKKLAWKEISRRYNAHPHVAVPRTAEQLRKFWDNMKQRRRKIMFEQQREIDPLGNVVTNFTAPAQILIKNEDQLMETAATIQEIHPPLQPVPDIITSEANTSTSTSQEYLLIKIIEDERVQQQELHDIRLEIAKEELRKMRAEARKAEAEEQLALYQLQHYKQVNRLM